MPDGERDDNVFVNPFHVSREIYPQIIDFVDLMRAARSGLSGAFRVPLAVMMTKCVGHRSKVLLRQQSAINALRRSGPQLISPADAPEAAAPPARLFHWCDRQKPLNFRRGNAVCPGGLHAAQFFLKSTA